MQSVRWVQTISPTKDKSREMFNIKQQLASFYLFIYLNKYFIINIYCNKPRPLAPRLINHL